MTDLPERYGLHIQTRAGRDIEAHLGRLAEIAGADVAREWREGLLTAVSTLAENPRRCPLIPEQTRFLRETRQLLYRRTPSGPAWRVLFIIEDTEAGSLEPPTVHLIHVRHGAQRPITRTEAKQLETNE